MILLQQYFEHPNDDRRKEIIEAMKFNEQLAKDKVFQCYCVITENCECPIDTLYTYNVSHKMTYKQFFDFANKMFPGQIVVLSNVDIYFDKTIKLVENFDFDKRAICLSRWDRNKETNEWEPRPDTLKVGNSQDTWIFKTPFNFKQGGDFGMGEYYCDGKIAYQINENGYIPTDVALSVRSYHNHGKTPHASNSKEGKRVVGPYGFVKVNDIKDKFLK